MTLRLSPLADAGDNVSPGVAGFIVVVALAVALFFLIRSMNKQISRIEAPHAEDLKQAEWERRQAEAAGKPDSPEPDSPEPDSPEPDSPEPDSPGPAQSDAPESRDERDG